jgi:Rho GDP-dissociation inhibitor/dynein assembly factor 5
MSEDAGIEIDAEELDKNYKPPPQKTLEEILEADKEDESLRRYKEALLGAATTGNQIVVGKYVPRITKLE